MASPCRDHAVASRRARATKVGADIKGLITFHRCEETAIQGVVFRVRPHPSGSRDIPLRYTEGEAPFDLVLSKQLYPRVHHPCW